MTFLKIYDNEYYVRVLNLDKFTNIRMQCDVEGRLNYLQFDDEYYMIHTNDRFNEMKESRKMYHFVGSEALESMRNQLVKIFDLRGKSDEKGMGVHILWRRGGFMTEFGGMSEVW